MGLTTRSAKLSASSKALTWLTDQPRGMPLKTGKNYKGRCPFYAGHTPLFTVSPSIAMALLWLWLGGDAEIRGRK